MPRTKPSGAPAERKATADAAGDAEVMARIERGADPARAERVTERHLAMSSLIAEWTYDAATDLDTNAIHTLNAIVWLVTGGDAEGMQELGDTARKVMATKPSEAHRTLERRTSAAVAAIAEHLRDGGNEGKRIAARNAMMAVLAVLAQEPDAFPIADTSFDANERAYAAVKAALTECAESGDPPMGPVLKKWGCSEKTIRNVLQNARR